MSLRKITSGLVCEPDLPGFVFAGERHEREIDGDERIFWPQNPPRNTIAQLHPKTTASARAVARSPLHCAPLTGAAPLLWFRSHAVAAVNPRHRGAQ